MALKQQFEEYLKTLPEDSAKAMRDLAEKVPAIQEGFLRQSDYDKFLNEKKSALEKADEWKKWAEGAVPEYDRMKKTHTELESQVSTLQAQIDAATAAAAAAGETIDPAKLTTAVLAEIKKAGYVSQSDIPKLIAEQGQKLITDNVDGKLKAAEERFFKETVPSQAAWITGMVDAMMDYQSEFGKKLDKQAFANFMTENKIGDPKAAYERFVEPQRREKAIEVEVQKRLSDIRSKDIPGVTANQPMGHMQIRVERPGTTTEPESLKDAVLGDNRAAMAAAAELATEGK